MKIFPRGLERMVAAAAAAVRSLLFICDAAPILMIPDTCVRGWQSQDQDNAGPSCARAAAQHKHAIHF